MPVFEFTQQVEHVITVKANSEEEAAEYVAELGDDGFADVIWGDTTCKEVDEDSFVDEDMTEE